MHIIISVWVRCYTSLTHTHDISPHGEVASAFMFQLMLPWVVRKNWLNTEQTQTSKTDEPNNSCGNQWEICQIFFEVFSDSAEISVWPPSRQVRVFHATSCAKQPTQQMDPKLLCTCCLRCCCALRVITENHNTFQLFWAAADRIWPEQLEEPRWQKSTKSQSDDVLSAIWVIWWSKKWIEGTILDNFTR